MQLAHLDGSGRALCQAEASLGGRLLWGKIVLIVHSDPSFPQGPCASQGKAATLFAEVRPQNYCLCPLLPGGKH